MDDILVQQMVPILVKQFIEPITEKLKEISRDSAVKLKFNLNHSFSGYLERSFERYSKTKTLLYRDMPVNIKDYYVRTDLEINFKKIDSNRFIQLIEENKRLIVSGSGGCGKSTFCKSIFIELIEQPRGIFPIFIELRHLNSLDEKSLSEYILNEIKEISPKFDKKELDYALKLGKILIILDGFDEVDENHRHKIEEEILKISNNNNNIRLIISSRFDIRFNSWNEFYHYKILPLNKQKSLSLIDKLDYDFDVKIKFKKDLQDKIFDTHESFASNPLLLTLMLLTYEQVAEIPTKMHLFYEQAFLTLFNKHDSFKSLYRRNMQSKLSSEEFKRILEIFCLHGYCERNYYFEEDTLNKYLKRSIELSNLNVSDSHIKQDLLDALCILQRDGLGYTFTHRSFQEYFAASFLVNKTMDNKFQLFEKVSSTNTKDSVIGMILDMNPNLIEKEWIIPKIEIILNSIDGIHDSNPNKDLEVLSKFYTSIVKIPHGQYSDKIGYGVGSYTNRYANFMFYISEFYDDEYSYFYNEESIKQPNSMHFEELLLDKIKEDGDIDLNEISRIDPYVRELIIKSETCNPAKINTKFLRQKVKGLYEKHNKENDDILNFIFG